MLNDCTGANSLAPKFDDIDELGEEKEDVSVSPVPGGGVFAVGEFFEPFVSKNICGELEDDDDREVVLFSERPPVSSLHRHLCLSSRSIEVLLYLQQTLQKQRCCCLSGAQGLAMVRLLGTFHRHGT